VLREFGVIERHTEAYRHHQNYAENGIKMSTYGAELCAMEGRGRNHFVDFNTYVRSLLQQLSNYGQKAERIIHLLFQAYLQVEDEEFNVYVKSNGSPHTDSL
jgi:hypothetical protein